MAISEIVEFITYHRATDLHRGVVVVEEVHDHCHSSLLDQLHLDFREKLVKFEKISRQFRDVLPGNLRNVYK